MNILSRRQGYARRSRQDRIVIFLALVFIGMMFVVTVLLLLVLSTRLSS